MMRRAAAAQRTRQALAHPLRPLPHAATNAAVAAAANAATACPAASSYAHGGVAFAASAARFASAWPHHLHPRARGLHSAASLRDEDDGTAVHRASDHPTPAAAADTANDTAAPVPFPAEPDVDLAATPVESSSSYASSRESARSAAAALADLLPHPIGGGGGTPYGSASSYASSTSASSGGVEEDQIVEHAPLRTRMKSDSKFVLPNINPHRTLRELPFSLDAYLQLLHSPAACEIVASAQTAASSNGIGAAAAADPSRPLSLTSRSWMAAASSENGEGSVRAFASEQPAAGSTPPPVTVDRRPQAKRSKMSTKAAAATSTDAASAADAAADAASSAELASLRALLGAPGPFLGSLHDLVARGDDALVVRAYQQLLGPLVAQATKRLDEFIACRTNTITTTAPTPTGTASSSAASSSFSGSGQDHVSASTALAFIHGLQNPPFLDSASGVCVAAAMRLGEAKQAKQTFAALIKLQQRQHECFELYLWDLASQIVHERALATPRLLSSTVSLITGQGSGSSSSSGAQQEPEQSVAASLVAEMASSSSLARQFLHARRPFNPFHAKPYIVFIAALTNPARAQARAAATAAAAAAMSGRKGENAALVGTKQEVDATVVPKPRSQRNLRRSARRAAARLGGAGAGASSASVPKVKPALQLFNRLMEQPTSASLSVPLNDGDNGGSSSSSSSSIASPTHFSFSWRNLTRNLLRGVVDVAAHETYALQNRHADLLRAGEAAARATNSLLHSANQGSSAGGAGSASSVTSAAAAAAHLSPRDAAALVAFDALSESEIITALHELSSKKREALDLLQSISMHVLHNFIRETVPTAPAATATASTTSSSSSGGGNHGSSVASYTIDNVRAKQWRLWKLLLCHSPTADVLVGLGLDDASGFSSPGGAASYSPNAWRDRALHSLGAAEVRDQRAEIRKSLLSLYPGLVTADMLSASERPTAPLFQPSPAVARHVFSGLGALARTHLGLVHEVLEAYIALARAMAPVEARAEKLRAALETKLARRERRLAEARAQLPTGAIPSAAMRERQMAHNASVTQLQAAPLPPSPIRHVEALLRYMESEALLPCAHTFTLLLHKGLYGGGIDPRVRYASSTAPIPAPVSHDSVPAAAAESGEVSLSSLRPSCGDVGSDVGDMRTLQAMLKACGPAFRRVPERVQGVSADFISSLLIQVVLPRPVTLYVPARVRPSRPRRPSPEVHAPHSKLLESFSAATLHVLERQRRRTAKEDALHRLAGSFPHHAQQHLADHSSDLALAETGGGGALLPFETVRDQSGLLASLLGALEYVHSHPVRREVQRHARALVDRYTGVKPLPTLFSQRLLAARVGLTSERIVQSVEAPRPAMWLSGQRVVKVRSMLRRTQRLQQERDHRLASMHEQWRERDKHVFRRLALPHSYSESVRYAAKNPAVSFEQVPAFVVPSRAYNGLLRYYDASNNFASALVTYERMRHAHVSPSFDGAMALVSLAGKFSNDEALAHFVTREALPLSRHSTIRRAQLWHTLTRNFARFNSYSNADVYMRYLLDMLLRVLPSEVKQADSAQAPPPDRNRAPGIDGDLMDPFPSSSSSSSGGDAANVAASARKKQLDALWRAWASRGGVSEIMMLWNNIRDAARGKQQSSTTATAVKETAVVLDDASVTAVLAGVLHRSSGGDALSADPSLRRSGEEAARDVSEVLRHLARHGVPLAEEHVRRIAVDLPLFVAEARQVVPASAAAPTFSIPYFPSSAPAVVAPDTEARLWATLQRDNFASEAAWTEFCARNGVTPALQHSALSAAATTTAATLPGSSAGSRAAANARAAADAVVSEVPIESLRAQLLAAAEANDAARLFGTTTAVSPSSPSSPSPPPPTRSAVRATVLSVLLRIFNESVGTRGVDRAIDYLERIHSKKNEGTQQQQQQQ